MINCKGHAYFMVLIATMAMFVSISVVLYITTNSRNVTGRYSDFANRYDLAVAGNEQALFLLRQMFEDEDNRSSIISQAYMQIINPFLNKEVALTAAALPYMQEKLDQYFDLFGARNWNFAVNVEMPDGVFLQDKFHAITTVSPGTGRNIFIVTTEIAKYVNAVRGHPIKIQAGISWQHPGCSCLYFTDILNCLDDYTLAMVELLRISPPIRE